MGIDGMGEARGGIEGVKSNPPKALEKYLMQRKDSRLEPNLKPPDGYIEQL